VNAVQRATGARRLDGEIALVTGAARGIGASIVERLAAEGARVKFSRGERD